MNEYKEAVDKYRYLCEKEPTGNIERDERNQKVKGYAKDVVDIYKKKLDKYRELDETINLFSSIGRKGESQWRKIKNFMRFLRVGNLLISFLFNLIVEAPTTLIEELLSRIKIPYSHELSLLINGYPYWLINRMVLPC